MSNVQGPVSSVEEVEEVEEWDKDKPLLGEGFMEDDW
jgi:hypothetical protein